MILYKYYGPGAGLKALKSRKLGFSTPAHFNDPFELTALSNGDGPMSKQNALRHKIQELKEQVVILSLTRSPSNPLMWAHYGQHHTGMVIAYEVGGNFLNSPEYNLVPADAGDVIYTHTKSPFLLTPETMEVLDRVYQQGFGAPGETTFEQQALARRLFLTKHASWVYEEEVRIVKIANNLFRSQAEVWEDLNCRYRIGNELPDGLHLFEPEVPIHSVYLGAKNAMLEEPNIKSELANLGCPILKQEVSNTSWQLEDKLVIPALMA